MDVRRYDPNQQRDPDGKWGDGIPGPSSSTAILWDSYTELYDVHDESTTDSGITVVTMSNGDMQLAWDDPEEPDVRHALLDLTDSDVREFRDTVASAMSLLIEEGEWELVDGDEVWLYVQRDGDTVHIEVPSDRDPWQIDIDLDEADQLWTALDDQLDRFDELEDEGFRKAAGMLAERKYNPSQPRDPGGENGGQWTKSGGGAASDALDLAGRIELDETETLVSSSKFSDGFGDRDLVFAAVHGEYENDVRIGLVNPEDSKRWKAANKGGTAVLTADELRQLRTDIDAATANAKTRAREADKAWDSGTEPTDRVLLGLEPIAEGRVSNIYADLGWDVYLTDDEPISWNLEIRNIAEDGTESDAIRLNPKKTRALLRHLEGIQGQIDEPIASRSKAGGPVVLRSFQSEDHPRAPSGSSTGGQFAKSGSSGAKQQPKKAPPRKGGSPRRPRKPDDGTLSYDPNSNYGTGYDSKNGDPRVHQLQEALNRLGVKDSSGKPLRKDGQLGPKTTSAVKALQSRLGLKPDGKVTPALLAQIKSLKSLPAQKRSAAMDMCIRAFGFEFESRTRGDGRTLEGYAAVFNTPTRIAAVGGDFDEVITPGAFTRSLRARTPVLQFEHGRDPRVGAVPIGSIDDLSEDSQGLHVRATLFDNPVVEPVRQAIAGRAIKGMSFRFNVIDGGDRWDRRAGNVDLRTVGDADVHELGPVVFPAYDATTVSVRSLLAQLGPEEHRTLLRELAYDLRSIEPTGVGPSARSSGGADLDQDQVRGEPQLSIRQRLDQGALRSRGILK